MAGGVIRTARPANFCGASTHSSVREGERPGGSKIRPARASPDSGKSGLPDQGSAAHSAAVNPLRPLESGGIGVRKLIVHVHLGKPRVMAQRSVRCLKATLSAAVICLLASSVSVGRASAQSAPELAE